MYVSTAPAVQVLWQHALQDVVGCLQRIIQYALGAADEDGVLANGINHLAHLHSFKAKQTHKIKGKARQTHRQIVLQTSNMTSRQPS
jgi:hypothetical protein